MAIKIDFKVFPGYVRTIIAILPALVITIAVTIMIILPKNKEIKALESKIQVQENEIAKSQAKAEKLLEQNDNKSLENIYKEHLINKLNLNNRIENSMDNIMNLINKKYLPKMK